MPGNLNFEWEVEFTVDPRARTQYGRAQAEAVVHALYRGILGRDPDAPSVRTAVTEVQLGNLERLVASIVGSSEFRDGQNGVSPEELLDRFYLGILGRRSDTSGIRTYLDTVRAGRHADVVMNLIQSAEFERRLP
jgi:hypothetical protein